jgi:hypothetical protein
MGSITSKMLRVSAIAKSNPSAPGVLRLYNLEDRVFPYQLSESIESYPTVHLATALNKFEDELSGKLILSPRLPEISKKEIDIYNNVTNKEKMAKKILTSGDKVNKIYYNSVEDRGSLYLCRQFIVDITENIAEADDLRILQACCNYLTTLPKQIGHLTNLRVLVLSKNRLRKLPNEIGMLISLRELNLSCNLLSELPSTIMSLKTLNALHLDNNRFAALPEAIGKLHALKYLNVSHNPISRIPLEILKLPFLIELTANSCSFKVENTVRVVGSLSMMEMCARHLIRNNLDVPRNIDRSMVEFLLSAQECCFCGGPLFRHYYLYRDEQTFDSEKLPVVYKLCSRHYSSHEERITALFSRPLGTYPHRLIQANMPAVGELFNSLGYNYYQQEVMNQSWERKWSSRMSLLCLARLRDTTGDEE